MTKNDVEYVYGLLLWVSSGACMSTRVIVDLDLRIEKMGDDDHVDLHYIKSNAFREIACDGTFGGETPTGKVWIGFFTERYPLPRITRHSINRFADGSATLNMPGQTMDGREGLVRNVEFGVYLSMTEAEELADWLVSLTKKLREEDEQASKTA